MFTKQAYSNLPGIAIIPHSNHKTPYPLDGPAELLKEWVVGKGAVFYKPLEYPIVFIFALTAPRQTQTQATTYSQSAYIKTRGCAEWHQSPARYKRPVARAGGLYSLHSLELSPKQNRNGDASAPQLVVVVLPVFLCSSCERQKFTIIYLFFLLAIRFKCQSDSQATRLIGIGIGKQVGWQLFIALCSPSLSLLCLPGFDNA